MNATRTAIPTNHIPKGSVHSLSFDPLTYRQCRLVVEGKLAPFVVGNPFEKIVDLNKKNAQAYLREHKKEADIALGKRRLPLSEPALQ